MSEELKGKERKLVKAVLYYNDSVKVTLEGEDLKTWISALDSALVLAHYHDMTPHKYEELWQKINEHLKTSKTYP